MGACPTIVGGISMDVGAGLETTQRFDGGSLLLRRMPCVPAGPFLSSASLSYFLGRSPRVSLTSTAHMYFVAVGGSVCNGLPAVFVGLASPLRNCCAKRNIVLTLERRYAVRHYNIASVRLTVVMGYYYRIGEVLNWNGLHGETITIELGTY